MRNRPFERPLDDGEEAENLIKTPISAALIFRLSLAEFEDLKRVIRDFGYLEKLVYQRISADQLWIVKRDDL